MPRVRSLLDQRAPFLLQLIAAIFGLGVWGRGVADPDLGWQLLGGAWVQDHGAVPTYDFINSFNASWRDYHWLGQLIMYKAYQFGGFPLLQIMWGLIQACLYVVVADIIWISLGRNQSKLLSLVYLLSSCVIIQQVSSLRLQMVSILVLAIVVRRLILPATKREFWILFAQTAFLANVHVYWVMIPFLWAVFRLADSVFKRGANWRSFAPICGLALAGLLSPYTWQNYTVLYDYFFLPDIIKDNISEFQNALRVKGWIPYLMLGYAVVLARVFSSRAVVAEPGNALAALAGPLLAIRSVKFVPMWVLMSLPFIVHHSSRALKFHAPGLASRESKFVAILVTVLLGSGTYMAIDFFPTTNLAATLEALNDQYPVEACRHIASLPLSPSSGRDHVRILTHFNEGGWCRFAVHEVSPGKDFRVTTDGRTQDADAALYKKGFSMFSAEPGWEETLGDWAPDVALMRLERPLSKIMFFLPEWKLSYIDEKFAVFIPNR